MKRSATFGTPKPRLLVVVRFYEWLYYRCYRYSKRADGRFSLHWALASVYLLMILTMNIIVVMLLFAFVFVVPERSAASAATPGWIVGAIGAAVAVLHVLFLRHNRRYKRIVDSFSNETAEQQQRGDRLFGRYLVISTFSVIGMFVFGSLLLGLH